MDCNGTIHVIKKGDTLYNLSKQHTVSLSDIIKCNPYVNVYNLQEGDEIRIPVVNNQIEEDAYEVKDGDTLEDILMFFGISPDELLRDNEMLYKMELPVGMIIRK